MAQKGERICTECGEHTEITLIDDVNILCDDCIDELDYIECDECKQYWLWDAIKFYHLKDERTFCEDCAESLLENEEITEDDIDSVDDYTQ